jgi:hypothetical protein
MRDEHVLGHTVEIFGKETRPLLALQSAQQARTAPDQVGDPVLNVRRIRMGLYELKLDHIGALDEATISVRHISWEEGVELAHRTHPAQASDRIRFAGESGRADAAEHLAHR